MTYSTDPHFSRRRFLTTVAALSGGAYFGSCTSRALAEDEKNEQGMVQMWRATADKMKIETQALRGSVYMLTGSGGNIGVFAGKDGLLLVDSGLAGSQPQITKALAGISDQPLKYLVSTHFHFDHCDGNIWVRAAGAAGIAHPNTRNHLSKATRVPDWNFTFEPTPADALPVRIVEDRMDLTIGGNAVGVRAYGFGCHTDGDLYVHFPEADVLHVGDTFWNGHYPFIDTANGGSIGGTLRATEENLKLAGENTLVIPGHGPVGRRAELSEFRDMLAEIRDAVAKLKKEGKSLEEAIAAKPTAKWDKKYAGFAVTPEHFTRIAYAGV